MEIKQIRDVGTGKRFRPQGMFGDSNGMAHRMTNVRAVQDDNTAVHTAVCEEGAKAGHVVGFHETAPCQLIPDHAAPPAPKPLTLGDLAVGEDFLFAGPIDRPGVFKACDEYTDECERYCVQISREGEYKCGCLIAFSPATPVTRVTA